MTNKTDVTRQPALLNFEAKTSRGGEEVRDGAEVGIAGMAGAAT